MIQNRTLLIVGGIAAATLAVFIWQKKSLAAAAGAVGAAAGSAVVNAAGGVVLGVGDAVGIPRTNVTECERAKAEGRTWDASFACPAGDFIRYVFT